MSDGWHHIRIDLDAGTLAGGAPVVFAYRLHGIASAMSRVLPLRRLLHLCRHRRFAASLFPAERGMDRSVVLLRVHDALAAGASQREIACALFGEERVAREWSSPSDSLRSRTRRLIHDATVMAQGGYRSLLLGTRPKTDAATRKRRGWRLYRSRRFGLIGAGTTHDLTANSPTGWQ
ncbi:DUF2285 domain-containing protein [Hankyongella ginsenosidimutans]|uniref:DUF2285 domain-containing protein n=1 Tax=Hankyongella ginsenosidimutans TaxID=1763828 RepID=A0A4D7C5E8_9SPHN|nr:DUF2285 domain-containing protein [Hankyongella ginsenosidimutans]